MQFQVHQAASLEALTAQIQPAQWRPYRSLLVQVFVSTSAVLLQETGRALRQLLPHAQVIGATASESIVQARTTDTPIVVTITAFSDTRITPIMLPTLTTQETAETAAARFNHQLARHPDCQAVIMFWDSRNTEVETFLSRLTPGQAVVGGLASPARDGQTAVLLNHQLVRGGMVAVSLRNPALKVLTGYHFGWEPVSVAHLVTRAEGRRVYEINYQPAIELYRHYLDESAALESGLAFPLLVEHESRLIARTPMQVHPDGSIEFAGRIDTGQLVRLSFGDRRRMLKEQYYSALPNGEVMFIYSCVGRRAFLENRTDDTMEVFTSLPNAGFYTHGEIVTEQGQVRLYNETMTFIALAERPHPPPPRPTPPAHLLKPSTVDRFITLLHRAQEDTQQLEALLNNNAMAYLTLVRHGKAWRPIRASAGIRMLGIDPQTLLRRQADFFERLPPEDRQRLLSTPPQASAGQLFTRLRHEQGHHVPVMLRMVQPVQHPDALPIRHVLIEDLTPQEHLKRIFAMFEQGPVVLFEWAGMMERLRYVSSNAATLLNLDLTALQTERMTLEDAIVEDDRPDFIAAIEKAMETRTADFHHAFRLLDRDGVEHWVSSYLHAVYGPDGEMEQLYGFLLDITGEKRTQAALEAEKNRIARLAQQDMLTGLYNRHYLEQKLRQLAGQRTSEWNGLFFIDLDHFKEANDLYGHAAGDQVLVQFAERLRRLAADHTATLARFGGDEFVLLVEGLAEDRAGAHRQAETLARRILEAACSPFHYQQNRLHIGASIGVLVFDSGDPQTLLRYCDTSMYLAKRAGRNGWRFFSEAEQQAEERRTACLQALRNAVEREELFLRFQPQLRWRNHRLEVAGAEALLRWRHPRWGDVPPGRFLPLAEEQGMMPRLENWVLETAFAQLARFREAHPTLFTDDFVLSVNISEARFRQPDFPEAVQALCDRYGLPPHTLCLELTEGMVHADLDYTLETLQTLKQAGFRLALDDFGTGYSSLSHLKKLPIDELKIDRSFVQELPRSREDAVLTRTIIDLATNFRLSVTAEGVEDVETLKRLIQMGCERFQGFYIARPMDADALIDWMQRFCDRLQQRTTVLNRHGEPPSHALH